MEKLLRREDLTEQEASGAMHTVMSGQATPAALAGLLAALAMKGEQPHEIVGFARTMRAHAVKLSTPAGPVFDTCGTGGDRAGTFNISSAAALVVAATRRARRQARQPVGVQPVRQRRRVRGAGRAA